MLRRIYDWLLEQAGKKNAPWILAAVSFADSSFFPLIPDLLLIPMIVARRKSAWWLAALTTVSSVIGAYLGYAIGTYLFASIGQWIIRAYGLGHAFETFQTEFANYGFQLIVLKGLTPIPFKLVTIASGVAHFDLGLFTLACIISRSLRFFLVATILYFFGEQARDFIEKRLTLVTTAGAIALVGGFVAVKFIF